MSYNIQIAVDCQDAHRQADWWAGTLGWIVEPTDQSFIDDMISKGYATADDVTEHNGIRVWRDGAAICKPEEANQIPRERILFQPVPEGKTGKNRIHWDVALGGDDKDAVRASLEERGATFSYQANQGPHVWYTMLDPEGNEFCIS